MYDSTNITSISDYISKCYNKLADIRKHMNADDTRPNTRRDLETKYRYWTDEMWLAIDDKSRLEESIDKEKGLNYSNNN